MYTLILEKCLVQIIVLAYILKCEPIILCIIECEFIIISTAFKVMFILFNINNCSIIYDIIVSFKY